ncbi:MAG: hypothetical protein ACRBN8_13705 [Nannocystales bacterium]
MMRSAPNASLVAFALLALAGCRDTVDYNSGRIDFDPERPEVPEAEDIAPYDGDDETVLDAQMRFPTGLDLHQKVIWRTCTPNGGVCHNAKEYPDLRTPANLASAFEAPCNVQPGEPTSVFDGCEPSGDRIRFTGSLDTDPVEIAYVEQIAGDEVDNFDPSNLSPDTPGLHIHLVTPVQTDRDGGWSTARFVRTFVEGGEVDEITYASYETQWAVLDGGTHLIGNVREYQSEEVEELINVGIEEADANRNGVAGATADMGVSMLVPGRPEDSYLIARIRGEMHDAPIPGSRMPLANAPLSIAEMLGLYCLVEGWPEGADQAYLSGPIDYRNCSYSEDPEALNLLGNGVTWQARVRPILEANCGGCHSEAEQQGDLVLVGDGVYERLLEKSAQLPDLALIEPEDAENSYLYQKLIGADGIIGNTMPFNPLTGEGRLTEAELGDILTWISNGAVEDQ